MTTYFFDNNLSPKYAAMLKALDVAVIHLRERFAPNTPDEIWLPRLRDSGFVLVTADRAIRRGSATALARKESGITALFLPRGFERFGIWEQAAWLIKHWPAIEAYTAKTKPGALAQLANNGSFTPIILR